MSGELIALLQGNEAGRIRRHRNGRLSFLYNEEWRTADDAYPLSLSLPLSKAEHASEKIEAYLWGLLPDNEQVLDRWVHKFKFRRAMCSHSLPMWAKTAPAPCSSSQKNGVRRGRI